MKSKIVWSVAALLAGTSFAAAQNVNVSNGTVGSNGTVFTQEVANCNNGCSSFGNDYRVFGRAEVLVWKLGNSFSGSSSNSLPTFRETMPYGFRTAAYNDTPFNRNPPGDPTIRDMKDISGLAELNPAIQSGSGLDGLDRVGARITLGMFLDSAREWSAELSYFQLETKGTQYTGIASVQNVQFTTGLNDLVTIPGSTTGDVTIPPTNVLTPVVFSADFDALIVGASSSKFFGLEANVNHRSFTIGRTTVSEIYGLRYLDLTLNQSLAQSISVTDDRYVVGGGTQIGDPQPGFPPYTATTVLLGDYQAHNRFYGAQVGARFDSDFGRFFFNGFGKFGFGAMQQNVRTNEVVANTDIQIPDSVYPSQTLLTENRTRLAFMLEGNLSAGFHLTDNLSVFAGYNILLMSRVAQFSGNNAPATSNGSINLGTADTPVPVSNIFTEGRYYAHGLNFGLELRY